MYTITHNSKSIAYFFKIMRYSAHIKSVDTQLCKTVFCCQIFFANSDNKKKIKNKKIFLGDTGLVSKAKLSWL